MVGEAMKSPILVTGIKGFIGSNLCRFLISQGEKIIGFDPFPGQANQVFQKIHSKLHFFSSSHEFWAFLKENISWKSIFHLGAITDTLIHDEKLCKKWNLEFSQKLWEYATQRDIPFFYASSAAVYGNGEMGFNDEEELSSKFQPLNLYGLYKQRFDVWAFEQEEKGKAPHLWAGFRFFNVYGPGEDQKGKMASMIYQGIQQIQTTGKIRLFESHRPDYGHGEQKRDFIFVNDVVQVLVTFWKNQWKKGIYNLGTGRSHTFLEMAEILFSVHNMSPKIEFFPMPLSLRSRYQYYTKADITKLRKVGYGEDFTSLKEGISKYIAFLETQKAGGRTCLSSRKGRKME